MSLLLLSLYTILLIIRPMDWWSPILDLPLVNITAIAAIFFTAPQFLAEGGRLWKAIPELKMGAAWVVGATLSYLPILWLTGMSNVFQELGKIYVYVFLIFLLARDDHGYKVILWTLLGCTIWMAIHAALQHHTGYGFGHKSPSWRSRGEGVDGVWQARAFGTFDDPNDLCLLFVISIPLFYAEFRAAIQPMIRGVAALAIPLVSYGVICTNSRGGYVGIFAMIVTYLMSRTQGFKRWLLLSLSLTLLTIIAPSRFSGGMMKDQDRSILWGDGINMFKSHPLFGVGYYGFPEHQDEHKVAHNTYVHVLATTGIIGYLPFFGMFYFAIRHLRKTISLSTLLSKSDHARLAGLYSAGVGFFSSMYFLSRQSTHLPYILIGLISAKAIGACRTPEMFQKVFHSHLKDYQNAAFWGLASIAFMWITIRIANALS